MGIESFPTLDPPGPLLGVPRRGVRVRVGPYSHRVEWKLSERSFKGDPTPTSPRRVVLTRASDRGSTRRGRRRKDSSLRGVVNPGRTRVSGPGLVGGMRRLPEYSKGRGCLPSGLGVSGTLPGTRRPWSRELLPVSGPRKIGNLIPDKNFTFHRLSQCF